MFLISLRPGTGGIDTIPQFAAGRDVIGLSSAAFAAIGTTLDADEFRSGFGVTEASDADDRILYDSATGTLYYDADGNANGFGAIAFAVSPALGFADFMVIA